MPWLARTILLCCTLQGIGRDRNISLGSRGTLVLRFYAGDPARAARMMRWAVCRLAVGWSGPMAEQKKSRWKVPLGLVATGVAGAAVLVLRGCWHRKMSWPVRFQQHSYQVCLGCGIKRLFDEKRFRAYGPYSYDLNKLVAWERGKTEDEVQQRPA